MTDKIKIEGLFKAIDAKDTDSFVAYLTEDAVFRYGSQETVQGRAAIGEYVSGFFSTIKALRHHVVETWEGKNREKYCTRTAPSTKSRSIYFVLRK